VHLLRPDCGDGRDDDKEDRMAVKEGLSGNDASVPERVSDAASDPVDTVRTNPAVPVAGALGFVLLLSALLRRLRRR
jgi:hypothetical protein